MPERKIGRAGTGEGDFRRRVPRDGRFALIEDLIHETARRQWIDELFALQKEDGGWCLATLGDWPRPLVVVP